MGADEHRRRAATVKLAEVLSVVGAGVLGAGLALLAPEVLRPYVVWLIAVGVLVHGLGMTLKHRAERTQRAMPVWERALFIACWVVLAALALILAFAFISSGGPLGRITMAN
jgi:hypothetical protein